MDRIGKEHLSGEAELLTVRDDLLLVGSAADKHHAEVKPFIQQFFQRVQGDTDALVPHHPSDEQEDRHPPGQVIVFCHFVDQVLRYPSLGEINAIGHNDILARVAELFQVLPRPVGNGPDLVAGRDILHQDLRRAFLQAFGADRVGDVDIELGVISEHQRHIQPGPYRACQHGGRDRAVTVDDIEVRLLQLCGNLR